MKKQKLSLDALKVKSFVTSLDEQNEMTVKGGGNTQEPMGCGFVEDTEDPTNCHS